MSFLESCLTVAIIAVISMTAVPQLVRARETYELDASARQVASRMQSARIKAVSGSRDCRLRVTTSASYAVECKETLWISEERIVLPRGLQITANTSPVFHKRGTVSPTATITISDNHSHSRRVVVNITGRVRVD
jgi:Tfp pilus assembly protein FimT